MQLNFLYIYHPIFILSLHHYHKHRHHLLLQLFPLDLPLSAMAENFPIIAYFMVIIFIYISPLIMSSPPKLQNLPISNTLRNDPDAISQASSDYGNIVKEIPAAVLYPSSINDIARLVKFAHNNSSPFNIAAAGQSHSVRGQAMARDGVVVNMRALEERINGSGIVVSRSPSLGFFADVGGEQLWEDVLHATLEHGLSPVSWTDYLYLTVGGTLSNAGISGQTFRFGPQISNVFEMDVITGMKIFFGNQKLVGFFHAPILTC
jgi:cytokinin dehydrogenase